MSSDLKTGTFDTWASLVTEQGAGVKTVEVKVDHKAATRQAIILAPRRDGFNFKTRSDWKAQAAVKADGPDWDYKGIALHHAGNSFSCEADGAAQSPVRPRQGIARLLSSHHAGGKPRVSEAVDGRWARLPCAYGKILVDRLRRQYTLEEPKK